MRVISVDYGTKSIGLAICDELQLTVRPLTTIRYPELNQAAERIGKLAEEYEAETLVVGLPLNMDGSRGQAVANVDKFIADLQPHISIPVVTIDERLTSFEADQILREMGVSLKERKAKSDEYAAVLILQDYLDGLASRKNIESPSPSLFSKP
ncbi:MAG: Holliday junction resolvase RuvX [Acidobacteria bacterium]|nr:Holliday junction resolvase RuvX [Acidobacteriota bacterium]